MILLLDNYDSFTYNLYQYVGEIYPDIKVVRNDAVTPEQAEEMHPEAVIVSPGPGYPKSAGCSIELIKRLAGKCPILGVCLGHQAIVEAFGGKTVSAAELMHGKSDEVNLDTDFAIFKALPEKLRVGRYHSLISSEIPGCLKVIAFSKQGEVMAVQHKEFPLTGLQFHPESVLTRFGKKIIQNFICNIAGLPNSRGIVSEIIPECERSTLKRFIAKVVDSIDLTESEAEDAMDCIMEGGATNAQMGSFLTALRMKGETIDEITGFARVMRRHAGRVKNSAAAVDIVGTGGDLAGTFNISSTAAFVAAGAGTIVAKHGNRSVSSRSGSADLLESLGVKIDLPAAAVAACVKEIGIGFMFAPVFHQSMRHAAVPRREVGVRSVFNILGPLSNPASAEYMLLGVYDEALLEVMARVLQNLGLKRAMVVHGADGLDEITTAGITQICQLYNNKIIRYSVSPKDFGIQLSSREALVGGTPAENAEITMNILNGEYSPRRDAVVLNAGGAIYAAGDSATLEEGVKKAGQSIDSGAALAKLEQLREFSAKIQEELT